MPNSDYNGFICDGSLPDHNQTYRNISHDVIVQLDDGMEILAVWDFSRRNWFGTFSCRPIGGVVIGWRYVNETD